jgi:hypothetical protein
MSHKFAEQRNRIITARFRYLKELTEMTCLDTYEAMSKETFEINGHKVVYSQDTIKKIICESKKEKLVV